MRWVVVAGAIAPGSRPGDRAHGPAFHAARECSARAKAHGLAIAVTGDAATDALLATSGRSCRRCSTT